MTTHGSSIISWPLAFRPMHDSLIKDSLALSQASLSQLSHVQKWTTLVKVLRWLVSKGKAGAQVTPKLTGERIDTSKAVSAAQAIR